MQTWNFSCEEQHAAAALEEVCKEADSEHSFMFNVPPYFTTESTGHWMDPYAIPKY